MAITHTKVVCATCFPDCPCFPVGTNEWNACHTITGAVDFNCNSICNLTYSEYGEICDPTNPAANKVRLWAKDIDGVTQLVYKNSLNNVTGFQRNATQTVTTSTSGAEQRSMSDEVGDGTADQNEIANAVTSTPVGGGSVELMEGTYDFNAKALLNSKDNISIKGQGIGNTIWFRNASLNDILLQFNQDNQSLSDITVDGNEANGTPTFLADGISFFSASDARVDNVELKNVVDNAFLINLSPDMTVTRLFSHSHGKDPCNGEAGHGLLVLNASHNTTVALSTFRNTAGFGLQISDTAAASNRSIILGNHFDDTDFESINTKGGVGHIIGLNSVDCTCDGGILSLEASDVVWGMNYITNAGAGGYHLGVGSTPNTDFVIGMSVLTNNNTLGAGSGGVTVGVCNTTDFIIGMNRSHDTGSCTQDYGIRLLTGAHDNYIIAMNDLNGNVVAGLLDCSTGSPTRQVFGNLPFCANTDFHLDGACAVLSVNGAGGVIQLLQGNEISFNGATDNHERIEATNASQLWFYVNNAAAMQIVADCVRSKAATVAKLATRSADNTIQNEISRFNAIAIDSTNTTELEYSGFQTIIKCNVIATADGEFRLKVMEGGTATDYMRFQGNLAQIQILKDLDTLGNDILFSCGAGLAFGTCGRFDYDGTNFDLTCGSLRISKPTLSILRFNMLDLTPNDNNNLANLDFFAHNAGIVCNPCQATIRYARMQTTTKSVTVGDESGHYIFGVVSNGTFRNVLTMRGDATDFRLQFFCLNMCGVDLLMNCNDIVICSAGAIHLGTTTPANARIYSAGTDDVAIDADGIQALRIRGTQTLVKDQFIVDKSNGHAFFVGENTETGATNNRLFDFNGKGSDICGNIQAFGGFQIFTDDNISVCCYTGRMNLFVAVCGTNTTMITLDGGDQEILITNAKINLFNNNIDNFGQIQANAINSAVVFSPFDAFERIESSFDSQVNIYTVNVERLRIGNNAIDFLGHDAANIGHLNLDDATILTISCTATIVMVQAYHTVAAACGTTDTLSTINGFTAGDTIILKADTGDTITVDNAGNILLAGGTMALTANDTLTMISDGINWREISRSVNT